MVKGSQVCFRMLKRGTSVGRDGRAVGSSAGGGPGVVSAWIAAKASGEGRSKRTWACWGGT